MKHTGSVPNSSTKKTETLLVQKLQNPVNSKQKYERTKHWYVLRQIMFLTVINDATEIATARIKTLKLVKRKWQD